MSPHQLDNSINRIIKMKDIKYEIGDLMSKIDVASKQIFEDYSKSKSPNPIPTFTKSSLNEEK